MIYLKANISIITINVNGLNIHIKTDCYIRLKNETQLYVVYRKPTLNIKTQID